MKFAISLLIIQIAIAWANASDEGGIRPYVYKKPVPIKVEDYPEISVEIEGNKSLSCSLDLKSKIYICLNNNNPVLVKYNFMGFTGMARDQLGNPKQISIESVEADNKKIFEIPKNVNFSNDNSPTINDLNREYRYKVLLVEQFLINTQYGKGSIKKEIIQGSEEYNKIAGPYIDVMNDFQEKYNKIIRSKEYNVELSDGLTIKCKREETHPLTQDEITVEKQFGRPVQCASFKCDDIEKNGKKLKALLFFNSESGSAILPNLHLYDDSGIAPEVTIKKISSSLSPIPLEDYTPIGSIYSGENEVLSPDLRFILPPELQKNKNSVELFQFIEFSNFLKYQKYVCKNGNSLNQFIKLKDQLVAKLADADLVQYIKMLSNGTLTSYFLNPIEASKLGCFYNGVYLDSGAVKNLEKVDKNLFPDKHVEETISLEKANSLFKEASNMKDIAWKYLQDGCYARAHLVAKRFETQGIRVDKVWIHGSFSIPELGEHDSWSMHVAPIVYVRNKDGDIQKMVIDPALFDHPVTVDEWDKRLTKKTIKGSVVTAFPFPKNSAFMERSSIAFSSSSPYLPEDETKLSDEDKMNAAIAIMKKYKALEPK